MCLLSFSDLLIVKLRKLLSLSSCKKNIPHHVVAIQVPRSRTELVPAVEKRIVEMASLLICFYGTARLHLMTKSLSI